MAFIKYLLKTLFNLLILIFLFAICVIGLAIWSAPKLGPKVVDVWLEGKTGFSATVNDVDLKIFSGSLNIENIALINPPYYQTDSFVQIKQFFSQVQLTSLFKKQVVFNQVLLDIDRLTWARNAQNSINILEFRNDFSKNRRHHPQIGTNNTQEENNSSSSKYLIKKLVVRLGAVDVVGFPNENDSQSFPVNYTHEFTYVTDLDIVARQIGEDLAKQGISVLAQGLFTAPIAQEAIINKVNKEVQKNIEKAFRYLKKMVK